jgi:pimeloyl-ACP methyl ester carboxylesterase
MPAAPSLLRVRSGELEIGVREHSPAGPGRPTVVLVHGFPDHQDTWDGLVSLLPLDAWHVVTYDVRGAGTSDAPAGRDGYLCERLLDDLVAVLDAVLSDGEEVHLVGHDWGSALLWDAVAAESSDHRLHRRIASFTSISAPSLDHAGWLARHARGRRFALLRQLLRSWYVGLFCLPVLPVLLWRFGHPLLARAGERREGLPRGHWGPGLGRNAVNGLELYRANVFARTGRVRRLHTAVPVLVIQPERDNYVGDVFLHGLHEACDDLRVERVDAGHWVIVNRPELVAPLVVRHVTSH